MNKFIGEIIKREKDKPQGKHKRFVTKKVIVCTHYGRRGLTSRHAQWPAGVPGGPRNPEQRHRVQRRVIDNELQRAGRSPSLAQVFKYMIEQLTLDPNIEAYEKDIWEKTTSKLEEYLLS
jgi:hypothetical protein